MKLDVLQLLANPCDDEEDNMAMLCCYGLMGELFLMTRFPDEDEIEITFGENDPQLVRDIKVTLSADQWRLSMPGCSTAATPWTSDTRPMPPTCLKYWKR
jgi:hypothetical protein